MTAGSRCCPGNDLVTDGQFAGSNSAEFARHAVHLAEFWPDDADRFQFRRSDSPPNSLPMG